MDEAGQKLRAARVRLRLRYRDVEELSQRIANEHQNQEFVVGLSRLADIEHKGTVPSVYRLYSLCAIYGLEYAIAISWYGIPLHDLPADSARLVHEQTNIIQFQPPDTAVDFPTELDVGFDLRETTYLVRHIRRWGKLPIALLSTLDLKRQRYGFIGTDDWSMFPLLRPGAFVHIDETRRRILHEGWSGEHDRPIYFVEHREGYSCGWCSERNGLLFIHSHPASNAALRIFRYPGDAEVIGQIVGVAMRLDPVKRRHTHS